MKSSFLAFLLFVSLNVFSQGEASNWFFGNKAGIRFNSDNSISVLSTNPNPVQINTNEGCSSISDPNGNLLLYTDGRTVWDRNHIIMPNGNYATGTGLFGDPSSTQSGIIIPNPANSNIYYIFTVDEPHHDNAAVYPSQFTGTYSDGGTLPTADDGYNNGLNYSVVDMSVTGGNGSIGNITTRNTHLITYDINPLGEEIKYKCSEKITAVKTRSGTGYWVITHFTNKFYAFKIDANGVNPNPVVTNINPMVPVSGYRRNAIGQIKVSPNGKKIAIAHNQLGATTGVTEGNGTVYIYDFDNETGIVSNGIRVIQNANPYGVEFSAETKKLYITTGSGVMQFNVISGADIESTGIDLHSTGSSSLQLGPDKKIYKANINTNNDASLDVINNPELDGPLCNYTPHAIGLVAGTSRFGLPPFITSVFNSTITAKNLCLGDTTLFEVTANGTIDSVTWNFGDGTATTASASPSHQYGTTGNYIVSVTVTVEGTPITSTKQITISNLPDAFPSTLEQCSLTTPTNILFNLSQANDEITGGNTNVSVTYYLTNADANDATNALPNNYANLSNPQQIVAKIVNNASTCYTMTTLDLVVNVSNNSEIIFQKCDDFTEDGLTQFNLSEIQFPAISTTATITFHDSLDDALLEQSQLGVNYSNTSANTQLIYARAEENGACLGIFPIRLIVNPLPQITLQDLKYVCINRPTQTTTLTAGLLQGNVANFDFEWSTGATSSTILVNQPGNYTVKVKNEFGCEKIRTITVLPSNNATVENVQIVDLAQNNTVTVILNATSVGSYLYSIDSPNGPFQVSNHFENVVAGFHTVYVYDTHGCGTSKEEISVLEIPKFFTPNQDGANDTWNIIGMNASFYANSKIYIFDRFGKLLADVDPKSPGWNGVYNGHNLPSTDYWYLITLDNGKTVRGHFSLVR